MHQALPLVLSVLYSVRNVLLLDVLFRVGDGFGAFIALQHSFSPDIT